MTFSSVTENRINQLKRQIGELNPVSDWSQIDELTSNLTNYLIATGTANTSGGTAVATSSTTAVGLVNLTAERYTNFPHSSSTTTDAEQLDKVPTAATAAIIEVTGEVVYSTTNPPTTKQQFFTAGNGDWIELDTPEEISLFRVRNSADGQNSSLSVQYYGKA